eukprot:SAG31_NODE_9066_length_1341_cov_1.070048_1_plen_46_part_00
MCTAVTLDDLDVPNFRKFDYRTVLRTKFSSSREEWTEVLSVPILI